MHRARASLLIVTVILILVQACSTWTEPPTTTDLGGVRLSIHLSNVGSLSKTATIDLQSLFIELKSGTVTVRDTVELSGNSQIIITGSYTDLIEGSWSVKAESRDVNDIVIHSDSTNFTLIPPNTVDVSLSLTSKYSMLIANFVGIADSVNRCELLVDSEMVADSSFLAQSVVGSTLSLSYDYLETGVDHNIKLEAYGNMWGAEYLLYTGDTTITVVAGVDSIYTINLDWVGPEAPPSGTASVQISIGKLGLNTVNGEFAYLGESVTDVDGNVYRAIQIGDQLWMAENLRVTHYNDGTPVADGQDSSDWIGTTAGAYSVYGDNVEGELDAYGLLYNWYAAIGDDIGDGTGEKNIAPVGWHVPTNEEWETLITYLGGDSIAGGKMKEVGFTYWNQPNEGASNESGFSARPGGARGAFDGLYYNEGNIAGFLTATDAVWGASIIYYRLHNAQSLIGLWTSRHGTGFSIRCVKD